MYVPWNLARAHRGRQVLIMRLFFLCHVILVVSSEIVTQPDGIDGIVSAGPSSEPRIVSPSSLPSHEDQEKRDDGPTSPTASPAEKIHVNVVHDDDDRLRSLDDGGKAVTPPSTVDPTPVPPPVVETPAVIPNSNQIDDEELNAVKDDAQNDAVASQTHSSLDAKHEAHVEDQNPMEVETEGRSTEESAPVDAAPSTGQTSKPSQSDSPLGMENELERLKPEPIQDSPGGEKGETQAETQSSQEPARAVEKTVDLSGAQSVEAAAASEPATASGTRTTEIGEDSTKVKEPEVVEEPTSSGDGPPTSPEETDPEILDFKEWKIRMLENEKEMKKKQHEDESLLREALEQEAAMNTVPADAEKTVDVKEPKATATVAPKPHRLKGTGCT